MIQAALAQAYKAESGRVLAALIAQFCDFDLAEEALQDAMIEAARTWPSGGTPSSAGAWLLAVSRRRALDRLRKVTRAKDEALLQNLALIAEDQPEDEAAQDIPDERLRLIFTCCHPAIAQEAQVALTLRTLCGLTAREIARAFLVPHATMNQRLTRAKAKIRHAGIPYKVPEGPDIPARLEAVLSVIYLIFNAGYAPRNPALSAEALRLCEVLHCLQPRPETAGLLALMELHMARDPAKLDATNTLISLKDQDRALWDHPAITRAKTRLLHTLAQSRPGPYQIQAAISALHCEAKSWSATDWPQILALYDALYARAPSPVVALNRAVAKAHAGKPEAALATLETLELALTGYQPFHAAKAELLAQCGHAARHEYDRAISLTTAPEEQAFLRQKQQIPRDFRAQLWHPPRMRRFGTPPDPARSYTPRPGIYAIITRGSQILLTEQSEPGLPVEIQLPGGGIDPGEQRLPALHREVFEETGWKVAPIRHFATYKRYTYMPEYDLYAMKIAHIFLCQAVRRLGPPSEPHHREVWASLAEAPDMLGPEGDRHYLRLFNRKNNG